MSMTTPTPEPSPEDVEAMLAGLEQHLVEVVEPVAEPEPAPDDEDDDELVDAEFDDEPRPSVELEPYRMVLPVVQTKRVQELQAEVAEAHLLVQLQADETPLMVETPKVRRRRLAAAEAARLHALAQDSVTLAYRDQKVRRLVTSMVMTAAGIALSASAIGVQASVAKALDLKENTLAWWAAFGVEPAMSLPLLATVGVQAYSAMRGQVVDRKSPAGKKLFRTEMLLLGLTLILNCWPAFRTDFDPLMLIVHALGPVAAVTAVWVLPALWQVLAMLPAGRLTAGLTAPLTGLTYSANTPPQGADIEALVGRVRGLIGEGRLPAAPSANQIQKTLRCGMDNARAVRDRIAGDA